MVKGETAGMKRLPLQKLLQRVRRSAAAVKGIAYEGMLDEAKMNANLVGPPCLQAHLEQAERAGASEDAVTGNRFPAPGDYRHPLPVAGMSSDRRFDPAYRRPYLPVHQGQVFPPQGARFQLSGKAAVHIIAFGYKQQSRCILVQPVHDAWAFRPAQGGKCAAVSEQGADEGAPLVARGGMDDHPPGLVDHQQIIVLVDDIEGNLLRPRRRRRRRDKKADNVAGLEPVIFSGTGRAIELHKTLFDELLGLAARKRAFRCSQKQIEPPAAIRRGGNKLKSLQSPRLQSTGFSLYRGALFFEPLLFGEAEKR